MTRLDKVLAYAESNRLAVCAIAVLLIGLIAWVDWLSPDSSIGFLYLVPVLLSAAALNGAQILVMAVLCGYLREVFDPLQGAPMTVGPALWHAFNPLRWVPGSYGRLSVSVAGFAMTGFFFAELNRRRRLLSEHLAAREEQIRFRQETELQVRTLIETSPLAILTLDRTGRVLLANESARQLLGFEKEPLQGEDVEPYLPILCRMLHSHRSGATFAPTSSVKGSAATARSSWRTSGSRHTAPRAVPDWPRWCGTPPKTCATAKRPAWIP